MTNSTWRCEHGFPHTHEPPCCCKVREIDTEGDGMGPEDWKLVWDTFVETRAWEDLGEAAQEAFKLAWYARVIPTLEIVVEAVVKFDDQQKAKLN